MYFRDPISGKDVFPRSNIRERRLSKIQYQGKMYFLDPISGKDVFPRSNIRERCISEIQYQGKTSFQDPISGKDVFPRSFIRERRLSEIQCQGKYHGIPSFYYVVSRKRGNVDGHFKLPYKYVSN